MLQNGFAGSVLQALLGWVQSLFNGVWALFSGGSGGSMLKWLSHSWLSLLVFFLIAGIVLDNVVYLIRWRPFWWWFRKKRMVIDDEKIIKRKAGPAKAPAKKAKPSTYIPKRVVAGGEDEDDPFLEKEDVFFIKGSSKAADSDPFAVRRAPVRSKSKK